ncbi:MAG TPA: hypothetical protein VMZ28_23035 [Kofleriaceae bacterium]|nr:hypothetical protein [Kofleriaceae bacterium]
MAPRARRLLVGSWIALSALVLSGAIVDAGSGEQFRGAAVRLREWIVVHNVVVGGVHFAILAGLLAGTLALAGVPRRRLAAAVLFGAALLTAALLVVFPRLWGAGPFPAGSRDLQVLRGLVFAPVLLRTTGWSVLVTTEPRARLPLLALVLADLALGAWIFWTTPKAILAIAHAGQPLLFAAASALFVWTLAAGRGRSG